jgi:type II secretory pathway pseudopilin PulG
MEKIVKPTKRVRQGACIYKNNIGLTMGFTLIETMVTMLVGLLLLSVLLEIYVSANKSLKLQTALYHIQDNAQQAIAVLSREIQQAGNIGCPRLSKDFPIIPFASYELNANNKLFGSNLNELIVRYALYPNNFLSENMRNKQSIMTNKEVHFNPGDILLISNCKQAEIFRVKQILDHTNGWQEIIPLIPLHNKYQQPAEVSKFIINKFYIAASNTRGFNGKFINALFLEDIHHYKTELIPGINQMRIQYTIRQGGVKQEDRVKQGTLQQDSLKQDTLKQDTFKQDKLKQDTLKQEGNVIDLPSSQIQDWADVIGVAIDLDLSEPPFKKTWHMYTALQG